MKWFFLHFALCTILFCDYFSHEALRNKKFYQYRPTPQFLKSKPRIDNKLHKEFVYSIVTGKKRGFKKYKEYGYFQKAGMLHLLTPSGLHLSSLFLPIYFFINSQLIKNIILLIFGGFLFATPGFDAAKRVWGMKLFLNNHKNIKVIFYTIFSLAYLLKPDLSFLMSFFFLGILILNPYKRIIPSLFLLMAAQLLVSYFFQQEYYPLGFIINPICTLMISLIFPFIIIGYIFPSFYQFILIPIVEYLFQFASLVETLPPLFPDSFVNVLLILFIIFIKRWKLKSLGIFILLFQPLTTI